MRSWNETEENFKLQQRNRISCRKKICFLDFFLRNALHLLLRSPCDLFFSFFLEKGKLSALQRKTNVTKVGAKRRLLGGQRRMWMLGPWTREMVTYEPVLLWPELFSLFAKIWTTKPDDKTVFCKASRLSSRTDFWLQKSKTPFPSKEVSVNKKEQIQQTHKGFFCLLGKAILRSCGLCLRSARLYSFAERVWGISRDGQDSWTPIQDGHDKDNHFLQLLLANKSEKNISWWFGIFPIYVEMEWWQSPVLTTFKGPWEATKSKASPNGALKQSDWVVPTSKGPPFSANQQTNQRHSKSVLRAPLKTTSKEDDVF